MVVVLEKCVLKFNAKTYIRARYYTLRGRNVVILSNRKKHGYLLAWKLAEDSEKEKVFYKADVETLKYLFGNRLEDRRLVNEPDKIPPGSIIICSDDDLKDFKGMLDRFQFIVITGKRTRYKKIKVDDPIYLKIKSGELLDEIEGRLERESFSPE